MRNAMIHNITLTDIGWTDYLIVIANAIVYFILGLFVFFRCEKVAMNKGLLGHY